MNKKGVLGLDTVKVVLLTLMAIAILTIVTFLVLGSLQTAVESADTSSAAIVNETFTPATSGTYIASTYRNPTCGTVTVRNASGTTVTSANYTQTSCLLVNTTSEFPGSNVWRVSYALTYDQPYTNNVVGNITTGSGDFFEQIPTFFVLLGVVVLILIIAIVIVAVSRFNQRESM